MNNLFFNSDQFIPPHEAAVVEFERACEAVRTNWDTIRQEPIELNYLITALESLRIVLERS